MCGICGLLRLDPQAEPIEGALLDQMTHSLAHRGPDDHGTWRDEWAGLGSRRLAIIDLSPAGHQPMSNEDGSIHLTYNGELYNFAELKQQFGLAERGHRFKSRTDTEVLIHLYEEMGLEMAAHLNGMYAVAIWDARKQTLFLIRDLYGIKPLFYQRDEKTFRFASEIKALLVDPRVPRRPSMQALHDYMTYAYVPGEQTAFEGIHEVPPAHWLSIDTRGNVTLQRYREMSFAADETIDETRAVARSLELMDQAVQRQLVADVPVGVMLSGGLDSSALVALMHRHTAAPFHTYSVGFEEESFNELPYARMVSRQFGTVQHEVVVTARTVRELLPKYLTYIDEPYADGSAIPTYCVCELARGTVVVLLSGEGGDEAFAGYDTYSAYLAAQMGRRVPRWLRESVLRPLVNALPVSHKKLSLEFRLKRFLGGLDLPPVQAHLWWRILLAEAEKLALYSPEVLEQFCPEPADRHFVQAFERARASDGLSKLMQVDSSVFLPDDLMIKNDRMSMAHSLEARVPLTDPDLTEFMAKVPGRLKIRRFRKKHIMRRALQGTLPATILNKKKIGLEMPYSRWLMTELKDLLTTYLAPGRLAQRRLFRPQAVQTLVSDHLAGRRDNGRVLWALLNYMMWLELYIP